MTSNSFAPNRIDTLIGASTRIDGNIACTGVLRVQGEVAGDVLCHEGPSGGLIVDSAGSVAGATNAPHIIVRGRVAGPTHSSQTIEIHQGASLIGDVSFRQLAIHAGGVVEGALDPTFDGNAPAEPAPGPAPAAADAPTRGKRIGIAAGVVALAVAVGWAAGWFPAATPPAQEAEPASVAPAPESARVAANRAQPIPEAPRAEPTVPLADSPVATPAAEPQQAQREEIATVSGANPSRPTGVFLLIAQEPTVLYRKRHDDAGNGTQLAAEAGEKVSISVDPDELIRVAKGRALEIYFQGQKVPRDLVERGVWIRFVPKPAPEKTGT